MSGCCSEEPSRFRRADSPTVLFRHKVDGKKATLHVDVVNLDLGYTFTHSRGRQMAHLRPSELAFKLDRKTTGFLALRSPAASPQPSAGDEGAGGAPRAGPGRRTVVAWAQSGHGAGKDGDLVDVGPGVHALSNRAWARRVVHVARLLRLRLDRPFNSMGGPHRDDLRGIFLASHVEVKLECLAVHVLLRMFPPATREEAAPPDAAAAATQHQDPIASGRDDGAVTRRRLRGLRAARWSDGSRPAFDIVFSRRHCVACGVFVARLTGVELRLVWGQRLVPAVYAQPAVRRRIAAAGTEGEAGRARRDGWLGADDETDPDDDDDDEPLAKDCSGSGGPEPALNPDDVAAPPSPSPFPASTPRRRRHGPRAAARPSGVAKPLPATPETQPPAWMAVPAVVERSRRQWHAPAGGAHGIVRL